MTKSTDRAFIPGLMARNTTEAGKKVSNMERRGSQILKDALSSVYGKTAKKFNG
jgi:hypothetical protein